MEVRGSNIDAYLDGQRRISAVDAAYAAGKFGVFAYNSVATYDDLLACALGSATVTPTRTAVAGPSATPTRTPSPTATPTVTETPVATPTSTRTVTTRGLYGRVTKGSAAATGVALHLQRWDGANSVTVATTTTAADGGYVFTGVPSLPSGAIYYVVYSNSSDSSAVSAWYGPDVAIYTAGASVPAGDFDIANVYVLSPAPGAAVTFPATFTWQPRGLGEDNYQLIFQDNETGERWQTGELGNVGSVTVPGLGEGMVYGKPYYWLMRVYHDPESYGYSYYKRSVTFQASTAGAGAENDPGGDAPPATSGPILRSESATNDRLLPALVEPPAAPE